MARLEDELSKIAYVARTPNFKPNFAVLDRRNPGKLSLLANVEGLTIQFTDIDKAISHAEKTITKGTDWAIVPV